MDLVVLIVGGWICAILLAFTDLFIFYELFKALRNKRGGLALGLIIFCAIVGFSWNYPLPVLCTLPLIRLILQFFQQKKAIGKIYFTALILLSLPSALWLSFSLLERLANLMR